MFRCYQGRLSFCILPGRHNSSFEPFDENGKSCMNPSLQMWVLCFKVSQRFKAYIKEEVLISKLAPRLKREMIMIILWHSLSIAKAWHLMWRRGFNLMEREMLKWESFCWWLKSCTNWYVVYQFIPLFTGFDTSLVVQDFSHQQLHYVATRSSEPVALFSAWGHSGCAFFFRTRRQESFLSQLFSQHGVNFSVSQITPSVRKWGSLGLVGTSIGCRWAFGASPALFVLKVVDTNWLQAAAFKKLLYFGFRITTVVQKSQTSSWGW